MATRPEPQRVISPSGTPGPLGRVCAAMSVTYVIEFNVGTDQRGRFLDLLTDVLDSMRTETMFLSAALHVDPADPNRFMLHETWRDHDDVVAVQLHRQYRREWHAALPDLLTADRKIMMWKPLRADAVATH